MVEKNIGICYIFTIQKWSIYTSCVGCDIKLSYFL